MNTRIPLPHARTGKLLTIFGAALFVFAALALDLQLHGPVTSADPRTSLWFHQQSHPAIATFMTAISHMHSTMGICIMAAIGAMFLALSGQRAWLLPLAVTVPGGLLLNYGVKHVFKRARPVFDGQIAQVTSYSFPSGHTAGATVWWGFALVFWLAWQRDPSRRAAGFVVAFCMIALTALSRVYLGFHYVSDVLAAAAEGCAWLSLCFAVVPALQPAAARQAL